MQIFRPDIRIFGNSGVLWELVPHLACTIYVDLS